MTLCPTCGQNIPPSKLSAEPQGPLLHPDMVAGHLREPNLNARPCPAHIREAILRALQTAPVVDFDLPAPAPVDDTPERIAAADAERARVAAILAAEIPPGVGA